jgi:hypothetical protein
LPLGVAVLVALATGATAQTAVAQPLVLEPVALLADPLAAVVTTEASPLCLNSMLGGETLAGAPIRRKEGSAKPLFSGGVTEGTRTPDLRDHTR